MSDFKLLHAARKAKKDEFYTQLSDIEKELPYYRQHFVGKAVYCNCDDPTTSNFYRYFHLNFAKLALRKLVATCYINQQYNLFSQHDTDKAVGVAYDGKMERMFQLEGDGDFRSQECIELLKQADIVVTNPPFSLFREYIVKLVKHDKKFLVLGNMNAVTYKDIFPLIEDNKIWYGVSIRSGDREFGVPRHYPLTAPSSRVDENGNRFVRVNGVRWFTNLDHAKRHEKLVLYKKYSPEEYPKYDNYDAINVNKTSHIPSDYDGAIGVPISFLDKYNPNQFEFVNANDIRNICVPLKSYGLIKDQHATINGKLTYVRIVIRHKKERQRKSKKNI